MNPTLILEQPQRNAVHRRISPPLIEKATSPIQVLKIPLIRIAPPELHIRNFEIAPKMARTVPIRLLIMLGPALLVLQPRHRIIPVQQFVVRIDGQKLHRLGPQRRQRLRRVE